MRQRVDSIDIVNPSTEEVIGRVPIASREDVDVAISRAQAAQHVWAGYAPADRASALRRLGDIIHGDRLKLISLETRNAGVLERAGEWGIDHVRDLLYYFGGGVERLTGQQIPVQGGIDLTLHEPLGVIGLITPWNFPFVVACRGLAPALAAGNAVVIKPSELTPLTAQRLERLAIVAGLPEGLVQVVAGTGEETGDALVKHAGVAAISFTGSTAVGRTIVAAAAPQLKRLNLELGGKSANIIFDDADLVTAARRTPESAFDLAGQDCCARSRVLVQETVLDRFMHELEPVVTQLVVGDPGDPSTDIGPLISLKQQKRIAEYVDSSVKVAFRGKVPGGRGYWYPPTVLGPVSGDDRASQEEIFGPVLSIIPFTDEADAIRQANATSYGLAGSIWTNNLGRAVRVAQGVKSGNLSVNSHSAVRYSTPFGGFKHSGVGRALGPGALYRFTETKNVFISTTE